MACESSAWAFLNVAFDGPTPHLQQALNAGRSPEEIARGIATQASWLGPIANETARRRTASAAEAIERAARWGFTLLHPGMAEWPDEKLDLAFGFATENADVSSHVDPREITRPHGLWVRGNTQLPGLTARSAGVVGTRAATSYGHQITRDICGDLAQHSYTIVSGGALGIDTTAHTTALAHKAPTIAVMASGPGHYYPLRNKDMFHAIVAGGGALISEYAPETPPQRFRFLVRNRLIAALTQGTIVMEAPYRSGALNTMKRVEDFGRVAMAVPGPITSSASGGCNALIRDHKATPIIDPREPHALLSRPGEVDIEAQLELEYGPNPVQGLSRNELRVYDCLPQEGDKGITAEEAAAACGLTIGLTVHLLVELTQRALVLRQGKLWTKLKQ